MTSRASTPAPSSATGLGHGKVEHSHHEQGEQRPAKPERSRFHGGSLMRESERKRMRLSCLTPGVTGSFAREREWKTKLPAEALV